MRRPFSILDIAFVVHFDLGKKTYQEGRRIDLNPIPMRIIQILIENHPRAISRSELIERFGEMSKPTQMVRSHFINCLA